MFKYGSNPEVYVARDWIVCELVKLQDAFGGVTNGYSWLDGDDVNVQFFNSFKWLLGVRMDV